MRAALYYAPAPDDPLWRAGCAWLGRDPETAATLPQPGIPGQTGSPGRTGSPEQAGSPDLHEATADARLYGFHATLKPPMRLATSWDAFMRDAEALAARLAPFDLPPLAVTDLSGFLALCPTIPCPALHALADACVEGVDRHRAPPDEAELARRRRAGLSPEREANLRRWGYPDVFGTWRFHMTLTRRLHGDERDLYRPAAQAWFAPALALPRRVREVCVFTQPGPGRPFTIAERLPLRG